MHKAIYRFTECAEQTFHVTMIASFRNGPLDNVTKLVSVLAGISFLVGITWSNYLKSHVLTGYIGDGNRVRIARVVYRDVHGLEATTWSSWTIVCNEHGSSIDTYIMRLHCIATSLIICMCSSFEIIQHSKLLPSR